MHNHLSKIRLFLILSCLFCSVRTNIESSVEQVSEEPPEEHVIFDKGDFRLKKYNEIWDQAQHLLNLNDQRKLYKEMLSLDRLSLAAKHNMAAGKKGGVDEMRAADKKFIKLLQSFKLYQLTEKLKKTLDLDEHHTKTANDRENEFQDIDQEMIKQDANLFKLWNEAKTSGFSEEELSGLKQEFLHYAQKQHDHKQRISDHIDERKNSVLNHFGDVDDVESAPTDSNLKLKQENKLLNDNFAKLVLVEKIENEKTKSADGQLRNSKSKQLWEKAAKSGSFNDQQLEDLLLELKHFDNRLEKLKFIEDDFVDTKFNLNKKGKTDHHKWDEYSKLEQKFTDYEKRVQKLEMYLMDKVEL